jgi:ribosomal-protein-alanine N-acetyltransferase
MRFLPSPLGTLEPQREHHAEEMFEVLRDPAIYEFEGEPPPSVEALRRGYRKRETRESPDGTEKWLNWVVRLPSGQLAGYVQATVLGTGASYIGYEFSSRFWRQGVATDSLSTMFCELAETYRVHTLIAVLKRANFRSMALLHKLGFEQAEPDARRHIDADDDEIVLLRPLDRRSAR